MAQTAQTKQQENPLTSIVFNIALPMLVLTQLSAEDRLGPVYAWIVGLGIPVAYGVYDFVQRKKVSGIAVIGFFSILLKGALGLLKAELFWFAVNEAALPLVLGILVVGSLWTRSPFIKTFILNDQFFDMDKVNFHLEQRGNSKNFERRLAGATYILGGSFFLSSILNFVLAIVMLKSPPGTEQFNAEMGNMMGMSYIVIVLPCLVLTGFAIWYLVSGLQKMTGLEVESILKTPSKQAT